MAKPLKLKTEPLFPMTCVPPIKGRVLKLCRFGDDVIAATESGVYGLECGRWVRIGETVLT